MSDPKESWEVQFMSLPPSWMVRSQHTEGTYSSTYGDNNLVTQRISEYDQLELKTFEYTDHNLQDLEHDIDPDNNFFSTINNNCCYYTDDQFNQNTKSKGKLSIIHFNSRSLYANFNNIKEYLHKFSQPFNIIAISETWINTEKGMDFELDGSEFMYNNRQNKVGGGVAIYVDKTLNFRVLDRMTTVVDNLLECITIEICKEKTKNQIISCIYRAPGSNIEIFKDWMECMFQKKITKQYSYVEITILTC